MTQGSMLDDISLADLELEERWTLAAICQNSFEDFVKTFWEYVPGAGTVKWNWHLSVFCDELQRIAERVFAKLPKEHDLVCNCPPGTSKSTIWSILFPAWVWTRMPECRILTASHTTDLVYDLASKSRDVIESELYQQLFPDIHIREDTNAKGHYRNDHGGERKVCTVAGKSPMGFHAHIVLTDDPIDPKKVLSEAELANAKQFVQETIISRVTDKEGSVIVLVMQRLGLGDPTDVMLEAGRREGAFPVRHVCLPAELEQSSDGGFSDVGVSPPEYAKRYIDGLLDPGRLSARALSSFKSRGPLYYATQFGQRPFAREGGMFQLAWFYKRGWVRAAPYQAKRIRFWDRAATEDGGCYTAGVLMAHDGKDFYVEHVVHGQWGPEERNARIIAQSKQDRLRYGPKQDPLIYIEAERGSTGEESFRNIARQLPGFRVREDIPSGQKDVRAEPWADALSAGLVILVDDGGTGDGTRASWDIDGFIQEHVAFKRNVGVKRYGKYKDQVDAAGAAYNLLIGKQMTTGGFRILRPRSDNKTKVRVCVLTRERLAMCEVVDREFLMVLFDEPEGVMCNATDGANGKLRPDVSDQQTAVGRNVDAGAVGSCSSLPTTGGMPAGIHEAGRGQPPPHLLKLLDAPHTARFADLEPAELQDQWDQELSAYGRKPVDVVMSRDDGKKLWAYLLKRRPAPVTGVVFVANDEQDRRAMAVALAYVDTLGLPRGAIWSGDDEEKHDGKAGNAYCYDLMKSTRGMVC